MSGFMLGLMSISSVSGTTYYREVRPQVATAPAGEYRLYKEEFIRANEERLRRAVSSAIARAAPGFTDDETVAADKAMEDAIAVVAAVEFNDMPWIGITDECVITFQWQNGDEGVLLSFTGDGVFGFAMKAGSGSRYSSDYKEQTTAEALPPPVSSKISRLSAMRKPTTKL